MASNRMRITANDTGDTLIYAEDKLLGRVTDFELTISAGKPGVTVTLKQFTEGAEDPKRHFLIGENLQLELDITKDHLKSLFKDC